MSRGFSAWSYCLVTLCVSAIASQSLADPPDRLFQYRFIPSRSTVDVTGGFAGFDWTLNIQGKFGLVTGFRYEPSPTANVPSLQTFAKFVDVDAILYNPLSMAPLPVPGWDLDDTLNLSGLKGTPGWNAPNNIIFRGEEGQGQPMRVFAVQRGPLIYLRGMNEPGCCDFFKYEVSALAHIAPYADFNLDGKIDVTDANTLMSNYGRAAGATFEQGDADGDGDVDGNDFVTWQVGMGPGVDVNSLAAAASAQFAVPEPATIVLVLIALLGVSGRSRRRHASYITANC